MKNSIKLLDVVALTKDISEKKLYRGQVGTVVEILSPTMFEVEFSDDDGRTYNMLALPKNHLMVLHYQPVEYA